MDLTEDGLLEAIRRVLSGAGPEVRVGVGDDAAVLAPTGGELVITTDAMVEDVHFVRGPSGARDLGHKAIVVNVSDIAAMGASPRAAVCALTLPPDVETGWVMELFGGMREACDEYALWLVGGDLSRGREVSIAVTVTGEVAPGKAVLRSGAGPGEPVGRHRRAGWERRGFAAHAPADDAGRAAARLGAPPPPPVRTRGGGRRAGASRRHRHDRRVGRGRARPLPLGASQRRRGASLDRRRPRGGRCHDRRRARRR